MNNFNGFSQNANHFLFQLQFCNTIEKQRENIVKYKEYITVPAYKLYFDLLEVVSDFNVDFDLKPAKCISTPYTDRRFSPSVPLKEYMYMRFRQSGKHKDILGLYFDMSSDMYGYGLKIYKPTALGMGFFRERIVQNEEICSEMIEALRDYGFIIKGKKYKADHVPYMQEGLLKDVLNMSNFEISISKAVDANIYSNLLCSEVSDAFLALKPFFEFLSE